MNTSYVALLISLGSLTVSVVNYLHARYAEVRELQTPLRNELRNNLHRFDYWRIEKILNQLHDRIPSGDVPGELHKLAEFISLSKGSFVAPTPQQLQALVEAFEATRAAFLKTQAPPTNDHEVFNEDFQAAQRASLTDQFIALRCQLRCVVDGLDAIQTHPMTRRKQIRQFKELNCQEIR